MCIKCHCNLFCGFSDIIENPNINEIERRFERSLLFKYEVSPYPIPFKKMAIPRLELMAAAIDVRLTDNVMKSLEF